ncbi:MAG: CBS domain-containing protein [Planctomycetota bacterium]
MSQIMSQELVTIGPNAHVEEAARTLLEHGIHGLPVVDEGQLVGILTDTDLFEVFARLFAKPAEHRLTLLSTPAERDPQSPDLVRTAVACGLEIASIFSQELPQGEIASEVAINGSSDAVKRYLARLAALGVTRIDSR